MYTKNAQEYMLHALIAHVEGIYIYIYMEGIYIYMEGIYTVCIYIYIRIFNVSPQESTKSSQT